MPRALTSLLCLVLLVNDHREAAAQEPPPAYPAPPIHPPQGRPGTPPMLAGSRIRRQTTRVTRPHAVYVELLGKGFYYSVGYDHMIFKWFGLGASFSYFKAAEVPAVFVNPYVLFYPAGGIRNSLVMQLGANIAYFGNDHDFFMPVWSTEEGVALSGNFGIGYEYRGKFLFRVMGLGYFSEQGVYPWLGLTFGGSF